MIASSNIDEQLGIRWGRVPQCDGDKFASIAGDTASVTNLNNQLIGGNQVDMPSAPFVDLGLKPLLGCRRIHLNGSF